MANTDTITTLLSIDATESFTKMKQWKDYMDQLKATLMGLSKEDENYNKVLSKLNDTQVKYTQVMDDVKGKNTEVADSYNALNKELVKLKNEYKNLSKAARENDIGKEKLQDIQRISDDLTSIDADMKQWTRNVGNYGNSFQQVFSAALGPLGKVDGALGTISKDVKGLMPLVSSLNNSAISGLTKIGSLAKAGLLAGLIYGVVELALHWEDVNKWVQNNIFSQRELNEEIQKNKQDTLDLAQKLMATYKTESDEYQRLEAMLAGKDMRRYAYEKKLKDLEKEHKDATQEEADAITAYNKAVKERQDAEMDYQSALKSGQGISMGLQSSRLQGAKAAEKEAKTLKENAEKNTKQAVENIKLVQGQLALYDKSVTSSADKTKTATGGMKNDYEKLKEAAQAFVETIRQSSLSEEQKTQETYQKNMATLTQMRKDGLISEEQLINSKKILTDNYLKYVLDKTNATAKKIQDETVDKAKKTADNSIDAINTELENALANLNLDLKMANLTGGEGLIPGLMNWEQGKTELDELKREIQEVNKTYELQMEASKKRESALRLELQNLQKDSEEYLAVLKKITAELTLQGALTAANKVDNAENQDQQNKQQEKDEEDAAARRLERWNKIGKAVQAVNSVLQSYAAFQENAIKQDLENGKITEKEAKKKFKMVKAMQYAQAVMQVATGVATALAGAFTTKTGPWDYALAIAQAASIAAAGAIQIATIKKQKLDTNGSGGVNTPNMAEVTNTYEPQYTTNVQTNTELSELANAMGNISPVVKVTDIDDAQNTVKVRNEENSF